MKKIICMLAMALLVIGAAQAQIQVRKMVVRQNDGQVLRFNTANIEEVTFEEVAVPTTVEEAKAMMVGYWKWNLSTQEVQEAMLSIDNDIESIYWVVTEDLKAYNVLKFADLDTDGYYAEYAGKYVSLIEHVAVIFNSEDPTTGVFDFYGAFSITYKNLNYNGFDLSVDGDSLVNCFRVEPFEYIMLEDSLMKNGLMKK